MRKRAGLIPVTDIRHAQILPRFRLNVSVMASECGYERRSHLGSLAVFLPLGLEYFGSPAVDAAAHRGANTSGTPAHESARVLTGGTPGMPSWSAWRPYSLPVFQTSDACIQRG